MAGVSLSHASAATVNRGGVPVWTGTPEVHGYPEVDRKLSCRIPPASYTYTPTLRRARPVPTWQWKRDGVAIDGATDPFYLTVSADSGKALTCTVTLTGEHGSASATSGSSIYYYDQNYVAVTSETVTASNVIGANTASTVDLVASAGWSTFKTTGSMTASSNQLTVADASGLAIGNKIIVATGGEAGAGAWGTVGVGGTNPSLKYATTTAMNADTSQAGGTLCWVEADGYLRQWNGSSWAALRNPTADDFYFVRAMPKALVTTITNKVGNVLTLAASAVVNTTNANVYFDNDGLANAYFSRYSGAPDNKKYTIPAGEYAFSATQTLQQIRNCYFQGAGATSTILFSPDGVQGIYFTVSECHRCVFRDFGIRGNHKLNSWGIIFPSQTWYARQYPRGIHATSCRDTLYMDLRSDETMNDAFLFSQSSDDSVMKNLFCRLVAPIRQYLQWTMNTSDNAYCMLIDCEVDSDYMVTAFECFRSFGAMMIRFVGRNASTSSNTSGGCYFDSPQVTLEQGAQYGYDAAMSALNQNWHPLRVILDFNTNIGNTSGGIGLDLASNGFLLKDPVVTMEGYLDVSAQTRSKFIIVAPGYEGSAIIDGTITTPTKGAGIDTYGVACDGDSVTVSGTRFIGFTGGSDRAVYFSGSSSSGYGRAFDVIGENIEARVKQRCRTNAEAGY